MVGNGDTESGVLGVAVEFSDDDALSVDAGEMGIHRGGGAVRL